MYILHTGYFEDGSYSIPTYSISGTSIIFGIEWARG